MGQPRLGAYTEAHRHIPGTDFEVSNRGAVMAGFLSSIERLFPRDVNVVAPFWGRSFGPPTMNEASKSSCNMIRTHRPEILLV